MRFLVCGLWHVPTHKDYNACAFSMHIDRMCQGLTERGHEVYHFGHPGSNPKCTEHIDVVDEELSKSIVQTNHVNTYDYSYRNTTHIFQSALCAEILKRVQPEDYVLINFGAYSDYIINALKPVSHLPVFVVENTIGYTGSWQSPYKVFESNSIRDWTRSEWNKNFGELSQQNHQGEYPEWAVDQCTPQWTDDTIPTFVVPELFDYRDETEKEDWFLYLGRIIESKGIHVAIETCGKIGAELVVAGQPPQGATLKDALGYDPPSFVNFVGHADIEMRKELMSKAKGGFACTYYSEHGGNVTHELGISGTGVIVTNWGSFTHNILAGQTGYFIQDGSEAEYAARNIEKIESWRCRKWNMNYTVDRAIPKFERYFERIAHIHKNGGDPFKSYPVKDLSHREMIYPDDPRYDINLNLVKEKNDGESDV